MEEEFVILKNSALVPDDRSVEFYVQKAGFKIVSFEYKLKGMGFETIHDYVDFISGAYGFDLSGVDKERLEDFKPPLIENNKIMAVGKTGEIIAVKE